MTRLRLTAVSAVLAALALSSCSAESLAERAIEKSVENAGNGGADVDFDADTGEFKVETDEGSFSSGGSLPDGFPSDDIPLLDGKLLQAASSEQEGSTGFVVLVVVDGGVDEAVEAANQRLLDAGFTSDAEVSQMQGLSMRALAKAPYEVLLTAYDTGEGTAVNYVISVE